MFARKWINVFGTILIVGVFLLIWSFVIEPSSLRVREVSFKEWSGPPMKIGLITDLHAGSPHIDRPYVQNLINKMNEASLDLVLIGGDLVINGVVGGQYMAIEEVAPMLRNLKARLGVYAVLGNHDWWNNGENIARVLEANGIRVLENDAVLVKTSGNSTVTSIGKSNDSFDFWLVGIGDDFTGHADPKKAYSKITSDAPRILFMHDPGILLDVTERFTLALAGHLHGGQVDVPGVGPIVVPGRAPKEWAKGESKLDSGTLFVSRGVGTSILPVRFNAPPEFAVIHLGSDTSH